MQLNHENLVPFLGVSEELGPFCLITPWQSNGNINNYIENYPDADRFYLVGNPSKKNIFTKISLEPFLDSSTKPHAVLLSRRKYILYTTQYSNLTK